MDNTMKRELSILIVEDDMDLAMNLKDVLEDEGYYIAVASDGEGAFTAIDRGTIDLALIDIRLPDISGVELVESLSELLPATEYIIITGNATLETAIKAIGQKKIISYETKPLDMGHLLSLVKQYANRKRAEEATSLAYAELDQVFNTVASGMRVINNNYETIRVNEAYCTLFGIKREESVGRKCYEVLPNANCHTENCPLERIKAGEKYVEYDVKKCNSKVQRPYYMVATPFRSPSGEVVGVVQSFTDLTERKSVEERLRLEAQILDSASDSIFLHDLEGKFLYLNETAYRSRGYSRDELMQMTLKNLSTPAESRAIKKLTREIIRRGEVIYESAHICKDMAVMPVEVHARVIDSDGERVVLSVARDITERKRSQEELEQSYRKLQKAMEGTTLAFELATEMRDPYTSGHQRRTTRLACAIAYEMGISKEQVEGLQMAGSIHDVGKMYVPSEILSKPGKLSDAEFCLIKVHPKAGYDILKAAEITWPIAEIVLQHHERMDGSGYPSGLQSEDILLEARILAVADVVEAMSSHRPYRPAYPTDKALLEIVRKKGVLYDCEAVDACMCLFTQKEYQFE